VIEWNDLKLKRKMATNLSKANWHLSLVTRTLAFVLTLQATLIFAQGPLTLGAKKVESSKDKKNTKPAVFTPPLPIPCPSRNPLKPATPPQSLLPHTVLLTWKGVADNARIAGYCLYRSENPKIPPVLSECLDCQLVSELSLTTTGCVDDRVENDKTYYYVVVSAASATVLSRASNQATAKIPKESNASPVTSSYPLCRETQSVKTEQ